MTIEKPFTCSRCGYEDSEFFQVYPDCGRPYLWDYIDTQIHPRDPNPTGIYQRKFWAWVFLGLMLLELALWICGELGYLLSNGDCTMGEYHEFC